MQCELCDRKKEWFSVYVLALCQKVLAIYNYLCYNTLTLQGSYIGNTTASQAVKAGSTPVPCSNIAKTSFACRMKEVLLM